MTNFLKYFRTRGETVYQGKTHDRPPKKVKKKKTATGHPLESAKEISWRGSKMSRRGKGGRYNRRLRRRIKQRIKRGGRS